MEYIKATDYIKAVINQSRVLRSAIEQTIQSGGFVEKDEVMDKTKNHCSIDFECDAPAYTHDENGYGICYEHWYKLSN